VTTLPFLTDGDVEAAVASVDAHLRRGGLLAYPTETVYGLGSRPNTRDVAALSHLKGRKEGKPFLLLIASRAMAERYELELNASARALAAAFWPGPLTLVLPGGETLLPRTLRGPEGGIAVRWTSHAGMARLIAALDTPITSTSANRPHGHTAPGAGGLVELFRSAVEAGTLLVLDGGVLGNLPPSTVVDCTQRDARLVREGALRVAELRAAVGRLAP
jgi:L-threonylcarbamoyladenylate synthase